MMHAISIHHIKLPFSPESGRALRRFYAEHLGLKEVVTGQSSGFRFMLGQAWLEFAPSPSPVRDVISQIAIHLVDLPTFRHRLLQAGHILEESIALPGYRRFFVSDPAGNRLEFLEPEPNGAFTV
jgi:catechol 2,3-dioxygenase-like lactoylglutathione lyase family enzyme